MEEDALIPWLRIGSPRAPRERIIREKVPFVDRLIRSEEAKSGTLRPSEWLEVVHDMGRLRETWLRETEFPDSDAIHRSILTLEAQLIRLLEKKDRTALRILADEIHSEFSKAENGMGQGPELDPTKDMENYEFMDFENSIISRLDKGGFALAYLDSLGFTMPPDIQAWLQDYQIRHQQQMESFDRYYRSTEDEAFQRPIETSIYPPSFWWRHPR